MSNWRVLSVIAQESPDEPGKSTPLHVIDYRIGR